MDSVVSYTVAAIETLCSTFSTNYQRATHEKSLVPLRKISLKDVKIYVDVSNMLFQFIMILAFTTIELGSVKKI